MQFVLLLKYIFFQYHLVKRECKQQEQVGWSQNPPNKSINAPLLPLMLLN